MKKINKVLLVLVVVLVILLIVIFIWQKELTKPSFYAVYLTTGDLYFGKLVRFPSFGLKQVYHIQVNQQSSETPLSLQRFKNVFWGPEDFMKINSKQVVWVVKLDKAGQLYQLILTNPDLRPLSGTNNNQSPLSQGSQINQSSPQIQTSTPSSSQ